MAASDTIASARRAAHAPLDLLDNLGEQMSFYARTVIWMPRTVRRYKKEVLRILAEVVFGAGSLAVIGGTVGVITVMSFFTGTEVGLQGFAALQQLGVESLTGFISAFFNTREIAPLVAGLALSATVGCGFTAQLGAMRISEEIDALEVMAVPSLPYLVTTRVIAGVIAVIPLYVIGLLSSYAATYFIVVDYYHKSAGTYSHYFHLFLPPGDVVWSFFKVLVFAIVLVLVHCYYGYTAKGGPAGVGIAVGRAVRTAIVAITVIDFFLSLAIWGIVDECPAGRVAMARESIATIAKRRLFGVIYLVVVAALLLLSIAFYKKEFTPVVLVSLKTDHTGNELIAGSDVKERGIIVGSVRSVHVDSGPDGGCANEEVACVTVTLALSPGRTKIIPNNVSAQILPKTLFGEQYVSLDLPRTSGPAIRAGDKIAQDRTSGALETEKVLGDLLPLLQAVKPAELNATLTAIATALQGRGAELGQTLVTLDKYLRSINPHTQALVNDLQQLGEVNDEYNQVAPQLFATVTNLETSAHTVITQKAQLSGLLTSATDTSNLVNSFLAQNEQRLITLVGTSDKVYNLLDEYSPEFSCLLGGLNVLQQKDSTIFRDHQIQLSVALDNSNIGKYTPGEQPTLLTGYGPHCFGLPDDPQPQSDGHFQIPPAYQCLNDGAALTANPCGADKSDSDSQAAVSSQEENALVSTLLAGTYGTSPDKVPPIATMLAAPLYRGTQVTVH